MQVNAQDLGQPMADLSAPRSHGGKCKKGQPEPGALGTRSQENEGSGRPTIAWLQDNKQGKL